MPTTNEKIMEVLHSRGVTFTGDDGGVHGPDGVIRPPGVYAETLQQLADDSWIVPRMVGGNPKPRSAPRPDIEDWNKRVEAKKLAKRYAKGK